MRHRRDLAEDSEEQGHVDFELREDAPQTFNERFIPVWLKGHQPEFLSHHLPPGCFKGLTKEVEASFKGGCGTDQRIESVRQLGQIPARNARLISEAIATPSGIRGIGCPRWIVILKPTIRSIVDGESQNRHVVGIHHPMNKADPLPLNDQFGGSLTDDFKPAAGVFLRLVSDDLRKI